MRQTAPQARSLNIDRSYPASARVEVTVDSSVLRYVSSRRSLEERNAPSME